VRAAVNTYRTRDGRDAPIELAYDVFGERGLPLVAIMGIGAQRIFWDEPMCQSLVRAGFQVVRFDARDVGESTHLDAGVPKPFPLLARRMANLPIAAPYTLSDMARDVIGLLDALGWSSAHVVGASLGGMVAQHLAIEHAARITSFTSIMSTPGARRFLPEPRALRALFSPAPRTAEESGATLVKMFRVLGSPQWPLDEARMRQIGITAFERGSNPRGFLRQFAAVLASGDRRPELARTPVPGLAIHGSRDPMFPIAAGRAVAFGIPNGTWLPIQGMGHDLPAPMWPTIVRAIASHAARADSSRAAKSPAATTATI
jgi:pimeloyl-ACP methyl ester carboxylesterase